MHTRTLKSLLSFFVLLWLTHNANAQHLQWEAGAATADSMYEAHLVKHDALNNIYTAGATLHGAFIARHDSLGTLQWHAAISRAIARSPIFYVTGLQVDNAANSYMCGYVHQSGLHDSGFVIKVSNTGSMVWAYYEPGPAGGSMKTSITDMVLTPDGNIALMVIATDIGGQAKAYIKSISQSAASLNWAQQQTAVDTASTSFNPPHLGNFIACDDTGNIYVCAKDYHIMEDIKRTIFAKYSAAGTLQWETQTGTTSLDDINGFAADAAGNLYAAGKTTSSALPAPLVIKINSSGSIKYYQHFTYSGTGTFAIKDIKADSLGHAYIVGAMASPVEPHLCVVARINTDGAVEWLKKFGDSTQQNSYAAGYVLNNNTFYAVGQTSGGSVGAYSAVIVARYDSFGNAAWVYEHGFNSTANITSLGKGIDVDNSSNILIAGQTTNTSVDGSIGTSTLYYEAYIARLKDIALPATNTPLYKIGKVMAYPQPVKDMLHINFAAGADINWGVYDMAGRKHAGGYVAAINGTLLLNTANLPAGTYIFHYTDESNKTAGTTNFIVVK